MNDDRSKESDNPVNPAGGVQCADSELFRALARKLESRGLDCRIVAYEGADADDRDIEVIVVTNPVSKDRGEVRIGDDGSVSWEYSSNLDETGATKILDDVTNCLRATGVRSRREFQA